MHKIIEKLSRESKDNIKKFVEKYESLCYDKNIQAQGNELLMLAVKEMNDSSNKNKELRELKYKEIEEGYICPQECKDILDKYEQEIESLIIIQELEECLYKKYLEKQKFN